MTTSNSVSALGGRIEKAIVKEGLSPGIRDSSIAAAMESGL